MSDNVDVRGHADNTKRQIRHTDSVQKAVQEEVPEISDSDK